jgi:hypothetical protein
VGFGGSPWGGGPWGGSFEAGGPVVGSETITLSEALTVTLPLRLKGVAPLSPFVVEVTFSHDLDPGFAANFNPVNYSISPFLNILSLVPGPTPNVILLNTAEQGDVLYMLTVATGRSTGTDLLNPPNQSLPFAGFFVTPRFQAAAQAARKVQIAFSASMQVNGSFTNPSNYAVRDLNGNVIPVLAVAPAGNAPITRAELTLGADLVKGGYYIAQVAAPVQTTGGLSMNPPIDVFRWNVMEAPITTGPLVIPIRNFSGEVSGGLLGQPAGQVFFSPALDVAAPNSVIQVEDVSLCTRAFDVYEFPNPPDPTPFFIHGGGPVSLLGAPGVVLWAPAERLGQARVELGDMRADALPIPTDGLTEMTLFEPIDITRGGFLNDARWHLYDGSPTTFLTYDNLTPSGPGPAEYLRAPYDLVETSESVQTATTIHLFLGDTVSVTDKVEFVRFIEVSDTASVTDDVDAAIS